MLPVGRWEQLKGFLVVGLGLHKVELHHVQVAIGSLGCSGRGPPGRRDLLEMLRGPLIPLAGLIEKPFGQGKIHGLDGLLGLLNDCGDFRILRRQRGFFRFKIEIILGNVSQLMIERFRWNFLAVQIVKKMVESIFSDPLSFELCNGFGCNGRAPYADLSNPS